MTETMHDLRLEIVALRAELDHYRGAWTRAHECAVAEERSAVVTFLRGCRPVAATDVLAEAIKNGEHRREEER